MAIYRLPFPSESSTTTWTCSGNWDVGGGHGPGSDDADGQCYAFDIGHPTGGKVLAARAGYVIDRDDSVPDNTFPTGKGAGNYIWIRHADNTIAAYLHLKFGSLRVAKDNWVPQGLWIASSGATGDTNPQPNPHLHFEVRTAAEPGTFTPPSFGTSLLIHFEDKTRASFRPGQNEDLSAKSNNVEGDYRQDYWRHCVKCRALYFAGNPGSVCPADGGEHWHGGGGIYTLSVDATSPVGQKDWRYCGKCHALFFGPSAKSRCPKGPGTTHVAEGGNYAIPGASAKGIGQAGWRWCKECAVLWFEAPGSKCPATGAAHVKEGSGDYQIHATSVDWQRNWRACGKCGGLFFGENVKSSKCVGNAGGPHIPSQGSLAYMPNYFLQGTDDAPGQSGWAWCHQCQCLWMGLNSGSDCHTGGGAHSKQGSGDYTIIESAEEAPGQPGWRWCNKCQGLWFAPFGSAMKCPAGGGSHAQTGGHYWVQFFGHA